MQKNQNAIFLHGFPELSYSYRYLLKNFAEEGYYCIAPDQRGYGRTSQRKISKDLLSNYSILNLAKDIFFLLCRLKLKKINLVGHDFGSYVAGYFCSTMSNLCKIYSNYEYAFCEEFSKKKHLLILKKLIMSLDL